MSSATSAGSTGRDAFVLSGMRSVWRLAPRTLWTATQHLAATSVGVRARLPKKLNVYVRVTTVPMNSGHATVLQGGARSAPSCFCCLPWCAINACSESALVVCETGCEDGYECGILPQRHILDGGG